MRELPSHVRVERRETVRFNSQFHARIEVYLRFGEITVLDPRGSSRRLASLDPALIGKTVHEFVTTQPAFGDPDVDHEGIVAALRHGFGEITIRNRVRSSSHTFVFSDGYECRFRVQEPSRNESCTEVVELKTCLSSRPPIHTEDRSEASRNPLFIAPWHDPEMLGRAVLEGFRLVGPPFAGGTGSVFDRPEPGRRLALHRAARDGDVAALPPRGRRTRRKLDITDSSGATPLMLAAQNGHIGVVHHLLELGADPHLWDDRGSTALGYAAESGHASVIDALMEGGADVSWSDWCGETALHWASEHGHTAAVEALLAAGAPRDCSDRLYGSTPLHKAARGEHGAVADLLLEAGAHVDARNEGGRTPLHVAAAYGHLDTATRLLDAGADVNGRDNKAETPLYRPVFFQDLDCIALLVERGADVNLRDDRGNTPLHVAALMNRDRSAVLLVEAGADVETTNDEGLTPLDLALVNRHKLGWQGYSQRVEYIRARGTEHNSEVAWALLELGATIDPMRIPVGDRHVLWPHLTPPEWMHDYGDLDYGKLPEVSALPDHVRKRIFEPDSILGLPPLSDNSRNFSILHDAVLKEMPEFVRTLLESGVCPETAVRGFATPLHVAAAIASFEIAQMLLDYGADLEMPACNAKDGSYDYNHRGRTGYRMETPLDTAIEMGKLDMVRFLLDRGAQPYPPETPEIIEAWRRNKRPDETAPKNENLIDRCPFDKMDEMMELFREYGLSTRTRWVF